MCHIKLPSSMVFWISLLSRPAYSEQNIFSPTMILYCFCTTCTGSWMSVWGPFNWIYKKSVSIKSCQIYLSVLWLQKRKKKRIAQCDGNIPTSNLLPCGHVSSDKKNYRFGVSGDGVTEWENEHSLFFFFTMDSCFLCFPDCINYVHGYWPKFISVGNR